jgi:hypothetical protein
MGDPELVARAQRAAVRLERSWDRWRRMHGLAAEQAQPVSSYVGYSLAEPWGRPRVVFGVGAEEAERLSDLLEQEGADPRYDQGLLWEPEPQGQLRDYTVNGVQPSARAAQNGHAEPAERAAAGDWAQGRQPEPAAPGDWTQDRSTDAAAAGSWAQAPTAEPAAAAGWTHGRRIPEPAAPGEWAPGHPALQQASAAEAADPPEPNGAGSLSADMAGWTSGELPGQASAGLAAWPQPGMPQPGMQRAGDADQNLPSPPPAATERGAGQQASPTTRQVPAAPATPDHREPETRGAEGDSDAQGPAAWLRLA